MAILGVSLIESYVVPKIVGRSLYEPYMITDTRYPPGQWPHILFSGQIADIYENDIYVSQRYTISRQGTICNSSSVSVAVSFGIRPAGFPPGTGKYWIVDKTLNPGDVVPLNKMIEDLSPGDAIVAQVSIPDAIDIVISGIETI